MDDLAFLCPACGKRLGVPATSSGSPVRCPNCRTIITAPSAAGLPGAFIHNGPKESVESIFGESLDEEESVIGGSIEIRKVELPPATLPRVDSRQPALTEVAPPADHPNPTDWSALSETTKISGPATPPPEAAPKLAPPKRSIKNVGLIALSAYAVLMTALAVWGWSRSPAPAKGPPPIKQK